MSNRNRLRVQEYISRSGKYHLSVSGYDDVKSAYAEMRKRARMTAHAMTGYPTDVAIMVSDETIIVTNGNARRVFSLVSKRGSDPVPFQYLLED